MHLRVSLICVYHYIASQILSSLPVSGEFEGTLITFTNTLELDKALLNVGPHLGSEMFDTQITYQ